MKSAYWKNQFDTIPEPILKKKSCRQNDAGLSSFCIQVPRNQYDKIHQLSTQFEASIEQLFITTLAIYFAKTEGRTDFAFGIETDLSENSEETIIAMMPIRFSVDSEIKIKDLVWKLAEQQKTDRTYYPVSDENSNNRLFNKVENVDQLFDISIGCRVSQPGFEFDEAVKKCSSFVMNDLPLEMIWLENSGIAREAKMVVSYQSDYFTEEEASLLFSRMTYILNQFEEYKNLSLSELDIIPDSEKKKILSDFNQVYKSTAPKQSLIELFEAKVIAIPEQTAIIVEEQILSYEQLNQQANQLANYLKNKGVKEESLVAICMDRSTEMIIALLAILKAGGAYVPIDPQYPPSRIQYILKDAGAKWMISNEKNQSVLSDDSQTELILIDKDWTAIQKESVENLKLSVSFDQLSYVIYTSGSTGHPKRRDDYPWERFCLYSLVYG